jgi:hypothetical protein
VRKWARWVAGRQALACGMRAGRAPAGGPDPKVKFCISFLSGGFCKMTKQPFPNSKITNFWGEVGRINKKEQLSLCGQIQIPKGVNKIWI